MDPELNIFPVTPGWKPDSQCDCKSGGAVVEAPVVEPLNPDSLIPVLPPLIHLLAD